MPKENENEETFQDKFQDKFRGQVLFDDDGGVPIIVIRAGLFE